MKNIINVVNWLNTILLLLLLLFSKYWYSFDKYQSKKNKFRIITTVSTGIKLNFYSLVKLKLELIKIKIIRLNLMLNFLLILLKAKAVFKVNCFYELECISLDIHINIHIRI